MERGCIQITVPICSEDIGGSTPIHAGGVDYIQMFGDRGEGYLDGTEEILKRTDRTVLVMDTEKLPGFVSGIIETFEEFLRERGITVPTSQEEIAEAEADGYDVGDSVIFGKDYYELEDVISDILIGNIGMRD